MKHFDWINNYQKNKNKLHDLNDVLPNLFDRYLLIPFTNGIIDNFPFDDYPSNKDTISNLNKQHSIEKSFGIFLNKNSDNVYREITLKEISEKFKVQYCVDTANLIKPTPGIVPLIEISKQKLIQLLTHLPIPQQLCLFIEDNYRFEAVFDNWKFNRENSKIDLSDYFWFQDKTSWDSCSYLFPNTLNWCLSTLEDYPHLIFCCDNSTLEIIAKMNNLETFDLDYNSSINWVFA